MSLLSGFLDHVGRLVHPEAASSDIDHARHRIFLATRFGLVFAGLFGWIAAIAVGHVPRPWEAMAVAWLIVPFVAAVHVSRTGRLCEGEAACLAAWWGLALTTPLGGGTTLLGGCVLLLVGPLEATFSGREKVVNGAIAAAILGAVALAAASRLGLVADAEKAGGGALVVVPALLFIVVLARCSLALQQRRQHLVAVGEERYRVLSAAIGDLVVRYDPLAGIVMASQEAKTLFNIAPRDLLGRGFFERVHVADRPAFLTLFCNAAATGENVSARLRFRTGGAWAGQGHGPEPVFAWIELRACRYDPKAGRANRTDGGEADRVAIVATVRDVSSQVAHEQAIEGAKQEAERVSLWKDAFLANVSHELRTPLNAIIGFSEMLAHVDLGPRDPEKQREYARIITTSGQHLLSVVNSLLDLTKIEAGCFDIDPEPFAAAAMIHACCDMVGLKAEQAGIAMQRDIAPALGEIVGDKRACKQIVINLLSNALKFTPSGGTVAIEARPEGNSLLITVADTGVGIAQRDLKRLGDAFFQAKSGLDRPFEGTGLGLSVVRGLVGLHGGTITLASAPDEGTEVCVRLPLDCRTTAAHVAAAKIETISRHRRTLAPMRPAPAPKVHQVA